MRVVTQGMLERTLASRHRMTPRPGQLTHLIVRLAVHILCTYAAERFGGNSLTG